MRKKIKPKNTFFSLCPLAARQLSENASNLFSKLGQKNNNQETGESKQLMNLCKPLLC